MIKSLENTIKLAMKDLNSMELLLMLDRLEEHILDEYLEEIENTPNYHYSFLEKRFEGKSEFYEYFDKKIKKALEDKGIKIDWIKEELV